MLGSKIGKTLNMSDLDLKCLYSTEDGITRCWWGNDHLDFFHYHDTEGGAVDNDFRLFGKICDYS